MAAALLTTDLALPYLAPLAAPPVRSRAARSRRSREAGRVGQVPAAPCPHAVARAAAVVRSPDHGHAAETSEPSRANRCPSGHDQPPPNDDHDRLVGIRLDAGTVGAQHHSDPLMAASAMARTPVAVILMLLHHRIGGLTAGAVA